MSEIEKSYLMRKDKERCYLRYKFNVDDAQRIMRVELIPTIGIEHDVYERGDKEGFLKYQLKTHIIKPTPAQEKGEDFRDYIQRIAQPIKEGENLDDFLNRVGENDWTLSEPTLVDRLGVSDPIIRDAFNIGMVAGDLFMHYKLIHDSGSHYKILISNLT